MANSNTHGGGTGNLRPSNSSGNSGPKRPSIARGARPVSLSTAPRLRGSQGAGPGHAKKGRPGGHSLKTPF